jgi:hypothetical protein
MLDPALNLVQYWDFWCGLQGRRMSRGRGREGRERRMGAVTPGETLGTLYNIGVGTNKPKQHTPYFLPACTRTRWTHTTLTTRQERLKLRLLCEHSVNTLYASQFNNRAGRTPTCFILGLDPLNNKVAVLT